MKANPANDHYVIKILQGSIQFDSCPAASETKVNQFRCISSVVIKQLDALDDERRQ